MSKDAKVHGSEKHVLSWFDPMERKQKSKEFGDRASAMRQKQQHEAFGSKNVKLTSPAGRSKVRATTKNRKY